ncbi:hypothetical protein [Paraburkholderia adhaesiva]|uniref:hypothetical protein n=1 Tax=Paraburkholderia adhaesiva TaxID=2883244 RepID=UPI001F232101|nr:hypothetical protein [Paraburkholderia adhaesiva]
MMDRYWQSGAVPDAPAVPASNAGGYPANGNPAAGINGTVPGEWWYYAISEELRNVIVSLGGTPDYTQVNQLAAVLANEFAQTTQAILSRLAKVATSGQYSDLSGLPAFAAVATSGSYNDLLNKPSIPAAQVNSDWNATSGIAQILNRPNLATVATSGSYADLSGKPSIPSTYILPPATTSKLGGIIAGNGTMIAPDGTLSTGATATAIVNLTAGASVTLDLTPLSEGAPEILFNLPVAAGTNCAVTISNPPASGTLAEFVLVVQNAASSAITWPSNIHWPQDIVPSLGGAAGKLDTFVLYTQDGGSTYYGFVAGQNQ